jgi:predicted alpha/beta superfamily hydrolase
VRAVAALLLLLGAGTGAERDAAIPTERPSPASAARLETLELTSQVFGNTRLLRVLLPPGYDEATDRRYPVLYLLDGQTLFDAADSYTTHVWEVDEVVSRLLGQGAIEPLIVVGIDNPGLRERPNELLPWFDEYLHPPLPDPQGGRFPEFLVAEVMPLVESRYRVLDGAEHTGLGGVSYGGLASLYAVIHRPGVFGRLLIESPGLYVNDAAVLPEAEAFDAWPGRVSLGVGTNEENREACDPDDWSSEAVQDVLRLEGILEGKGLTEDRLLLQVALCGQHDESHYRRRLPRALSFLHGSAPGGRVIRRFEEQNAE